MISCPELRPGRKWIYARLALAALLSPIPALAAESVSTAEWNITADRIVQDQNTNSIVAEGDIILEKRIKLPPRVQLNARKKTKWSDLLGDTSPKKAVTIGQVDERSAAARYQTDMVIKADWLKYDLDKKFIEARGNVQVIDKDDTLTADSAQVDVNAETGKFTDAVIIRKEHQLHLEGKSIEKTGVDTYRIVDGWAITCKVEDGKTPPWHFASSDTRITKGGYALMKNATFNIKGVPVLYSPYMLVPVKNTRQTGLLMPEFSYSNIGGFGGNLPFFWNISDSMDATFFPEFYTERGFMPGLEFRYVLTDANKGAFMGSYMHDALSDGDRSSSYYQDSDYTHANTDRYWLRGKIDQNFAEWQTRLDIDVVSDRDYLSEFDSGYTGFSQTKDRFQDQFGRDFANKWDYTRPTELSMLRSQDGISLQANLLAYNDVRSDALKARQEDPLWKLPQLDFSGVLPIGATPFSFSWLSDYVYYWRKDGVGGNRINIAPSISTPVALSPYLESRAELTMMETAYLVEAYGDTDWNKDNFQNRVTGQFTYEIASPLMRSFSIAEDGELDHTLRPWVQYDYIPDVSQGDLPEMDSTDRIDKESLVSFGIDNYFNTIFDTTERDIGYLKIREGYSLLSQDSDQPFIPLNLRLRLLPLPRFFVEYETDYDLYGDGFVQHSLEGRISNSRGDFFSIDYSYNNTDEITNKINQLNFTVGARLLPQWYTRLKVERSLIHDQTNEAKFALGYTAPCWSVELQTDYTPSETKYLLVFQLANIGIGSPLNLGM
ncbi:MAG: LPS-assembly protein LptD [Desulfopila sp.]